MLSPQKSAVHLICSSISRHLGCFHILAIVNVATTDTEVHVCFWFMVFPRHMPRSGVAGSYGTSVFSFLRDLHIASHSGYINLYFHPQCRQFLFSLHPLQHLLFVDFLLWPFWRVWGDTSLQFLICISLIISILYNGILLSHRKNEIMPFAATWPRNCHTEWSESERERQISHGITDM